MKSSSNDADVFFCSDTIVDNGDAAKTKQEKDVLEESDSIDEKCKEPSEHKHKRKHKHKHKHKHKRSSKVVPISPEKQNEVINALILQIPFSMKRSVSLRTITEEEFICQLADVRAKYPQITDAMLRQAYKQICFDANQQQIRSAEELQAFAQAPPPLAMKRQAKRRIAAVNPTGLTGHVWQPGQQIQIGDTVGILSPKQQWKICTVQSVEHSKVLIHYDGYQQQSDEWVVYPGPRFRGAGDLLQGADANPTETWLRASTECGPAQIFLCICCFGGKKIFLRLVCCIWNEYAVDSCCDLYFKRDEKDCCDITNKLWNCVMDLCGGWCCSYCIQPFILDCCSLFPGKQEEVVWWKLCEICCPHKDEFADLDAELDAWDKHHDYGCVGDEPFVDAIIGAAKSVVKGVVKDEIKSAVKDHFLGEECDQEYGCVSDDVDPFVDAIINKAKSGQG